MGYIEKLNIKYVNKVMPTVYDDSLSYYEVLSKILYKLKTPEAKRTLNFEFLNFDF